MRIIGFTSGLDEGMVDVCWVCGLIGALDTRLGDEFDETMSDLWCKSLKYSQFCVAEESQTW